MAPPISNTYKHNSNMEPTPEPIPELTPEPTPPPVPEYDTEFEDMPGLECLSCQNYFSLGGWLYMYVNHGTGPYHNLMCTCERI